MERLNEEQYERIARWLDGEDLELSAAERGAAEEIRRAEAGLAQALKVSAPPAAINRARRRIIAAMAHPRVRLWRVGAFAAASAAAAVLLTVLLWHARQQPAQPTPLPRQVKIDATFLKALEEAADGDEIDLIKQELDEIAADVALVTGPPAMELRIDDLERRLDEFFLDDILIY